MSYRDAPRPRPPRWIRLLWTFSGPRRYFKVVKSAANPGAIPEKGEQKKQTTRGGGGGGDRSDPVLLRRFAGRGFLRIPGIPFLGFFFASSIQPFSTHFELGSFRQYCYWAQLTSFEKAWAGLALPSPSFVSLRKSQPTDRAASRENLTRALGEGNEGVDPPSRVSRIGPYEDRDPEHQGHPSHANHPSLKCRHLPQKLRTIQ